MKYSTTSILALAAMAQTSMAHYVFNSLVMNGEITEAYQYVRQQTNSNSPITDVTSEDMRCNTGGATDGADASVATIAAGDVIGFGLDSEAGVGHPGPVSVYMSKTPEGTDLTAYDGSGDWFKVYELGVAEITSDGLQWAAAGLQNFTFTLPAEVPAGDYLLRAESIALHGAGTEGGAQLYIECAQVSVSSDSTETPTDTTPIPGAFTADDPGVLINIYYPIPQNYTVPGPAVWPAGSSNSSVATYLPEDAPVATSGAASASTAASTSAAATTSAAASSANATSAVASSAAATTAAASSAPATTSAAATSVAASSAVAPVSEASSSSVPAGISYTGAPSGFSTVVGTATSSAAVPTGTGSSGSVPKYYQCGGSNYSGATECESGSTCTVMNDFYSQCV